MKLRIFTHMPGDNLFIIIWPRTYDIKARQYQHLDLSLYDQLSQKFTLTHFIYNKFSILDQLSICKGWTT